MSIDSIVSPIETFIQMFVVVRDTTARQLAGKIGPVDHSRREDKGMFQDTPNTDQQDARPGFYSGVHDSATPLELSVKH